MAISWLVDMCFVVNTIPLWPVMRYGYGSNIVSLELDNQRLVNFPLVDVLLLYSQATFALQDYHSVVKSFA